HHPLSYSHATPSPYASRPHNRPTYATPPRRPPDLGFDSGYFQRSPYDSGTHNRPTYDTDPYGFTNPTPSNPGPPPQNPPSPYDNSTNTHASSAVTPHAHTHPTSSTSNLQRSP